MPKAVHKTTWSLVTIPVSSPQFRLVFTSFSSLISWYPTRLNHKMFLVSVTCPPKTVPDIMLGIDKKGGNSMVRKGYTPEQIINKLREAEIQINQGITIGEASRKLGVTEQTYYRWRKEYGGMRVEQAKRLKEIEKENTRLKKLVADISLDNAILKEAARGNF